MRRTVLLTALVLGVGLTAAGLAHGAMDEGKAGDQKGMMGHHKMMGHRMACCPFMTSGAQIKVTPTKTGATIEVTASDPTVIARIQKKAQIFQLMHELQALGPEHPTVSHESDREGQHESQELDQEEPQES